MAKKRAHYGISFTNRRLDVVFYYSCMEQNPMHRVPPLDSTDLGLHVHIIIIKVESHAYGLVVYGLLLWRIASTQVVVRLPAVSPAAGRMIIIINNVYLSLHVPLSYCLSFNLLLYFSAVTFSYQTILLPSEFLSHSIFCILLTSTYHFIGTQSRHWPNTPKVRRGSHQVKYCRGLCS